MDTQESRYVRFTRIAYQLAQETLPRYSHPKSPHRYTLPQLAVCVLLACYLKLSYRDAEEWLKATDKVCAVLELRRVPDHSTLARAYQRLLRMRVLDPMRWRLLDTLRVAEEVIASDSTGYATSVEWQSGSGGAHCAGRVGGGSASGWAVRSALEGWTVHSVIKRTLGDALCSRRVMLQKREPAVKGLVYNLHR